MGGVWFGHKGKGVKWGGRGGGVVAMAKQRRDSGWVGGVVVVCVGEGVGVWGGGWWVGRPTHWVVDLGETGGRNLLPWRPGRTADHPSGIQQRMAAPVTVVERGVGQYVVGFEVGMAVIVEGVAMVNLCGDSTNGQVHLGQPPGGVVGFLTVDGDGVNPAAVGLDEPLAGDEHTT